MKQKSSMCELNQKHLEEIKDILWSDYENVFLQINGIRGLINEVHLYFHWGFDMRDFPKNTPVILWHGMNDMIVPWSIMRALAHHIRLHSAVLFPGGHLCFVTHAKEVFLRMQNAWNEIDLIIPLLPMQSPARAHALRGSFPSPKFPERFLSRPLASV